MSAEVCTQCGERVYGRPGSWSVRADGTDTLGSGEVCLAGPSLTHKVESKVCPDCRCHLRASGAPDGEENHSAWNGSAYCDHCLRDRLLAGERVEAGLYEREDGRTEHLFHVVDPRCSGTGFYLVSASQQGTDCHACSGTGWLTEIHEGVQRTGRWWQTYLTNREPGKRPVEKAPTIRPRRR